MDEVLKAAVKGNNGKEKRERNLYFALSIYYLRVYVKNNPDMLIDFTQC